MQQLTMSLCFVEQKCDDSFVGSCNEVDWNQFVAPHDPAPLLGTERPHVLKLGWRTSQMKSKT